MCGLNDEFSRGPVVLTAGVAALPADALAELLRAVRSFDALGAGNDLHGEHDIGKVEIDGEAYSGRSTATIPTSSVDHPTRQILLPRHE
ncbi:hypothetical protein ASF70_22745 [Rhizobium sp. Leaf321]|nr:hypothetical protein ASF70_22745 [Rhizobium sp. Leaf321]